MPYTMTSSLFCWMRQPLLLCGMLTTILVDVSAAPNYISQRTMQNFGHFIPMHSLGTEDSPGMASKCEELFFEQRMDHFSPSSKTFQQRYFINDDHYFANKGEGGGPIFFYLGNEADVTLYVNATGLMWENAKEFGALIVFAEHRYYGKSQLFPSDNDGNDNSNTDVHHLRYLSVEQALMDYVTLINHIKVQYNFNSTIDSVIGFGGSYGGMLASWARFKYPNVFDGVIAASAPIVTFEGMEDFMDPDFFSEGITYDVATSGGVKNEYCELNLRKLFAQKTLINNYNTTTNTTQIDPRQIRSAFNLCNDDNTTDNELGSQITGWISDALSYMAMGNFPYPSSYILNGMGFLPAYPVRFACDEYLYYDMTKKDKIDEWLVGLAKFAGVYYNYTGELKCNKLATPVNKESQIVSALWNYQYCSQIFQIFAQKDDNDDMYWDDPWDGNATATNCYNQYGFYPDRKHFTTVYGTPVDWKRSASNIVWSQGEYDPWRGGGITEDLNDSLVAIVIKEAAHHLDLFFSHENDTKAVITTRKNEMDNVRKWIDEKTRIGQEQQMDHYHYDTLRTWSSL